MRLARAASRQLALGSASQGVTSTLTFLAKLVHARAVVEIGTGTGVSSLALLRGMACRLLLDEQLLESAEIVRQFNRNLSLGAAPMDVAA